MDTSSPFGHQLYLEGIQLIIIYWNTGISLVQLSSTSL